MPLNPYKNRKVKMQLTDRFKLFKAAIILNRGLEVPRYYSDERVDAQTLTYTLSPLLSSLLYGYLAILRN